MSETPTLENPILPNESPARRRRLRWILGAVVFCGVVCASVGAIVVHERKVHNNAVEITANIQQAPGLRVTFTAKRPAMSFNGQTTAQVYVLPHAESSSKDLSFDAFLSQKGPNVTQNYLLLEGRGYQSTVVNGIVTAAECLSATQVPPVHFLQSVLTESKVIDTVAGGTPAPDCADGKLLQVAFAGEPFVLCNSRQNLITTAVGADLNVTIEYLADPTMLPDFDVPRVAGGAAPECPVVVPTTKTTRTRRSLTEMATAVLGVVKGDVRSTALGDSSCGCKGPKKPCLFVHGVGSFIDAPLSSTDLLYWGFAHEHVPCCSSIKFTHFETIHNAWNAPRLQKQFCDAALTVSGSKSKTVGSIALIAHSMGNLVVGAAVASGVCNLSKDVSWLSISAPMTGSAAANLLETQCAAGTWDTKLVAAAASLIGFCPAPDSFSCLKTQTSVNATVQAQFVAAQAVRKQYTTKALCGVDSWGLDTLYAPIFAAVAGLVDYGSSNDGMVDFPSCSIGLGPFYTDPTSGNYKASINHADATFRNGDGWWGSDRKPVKWLECAL
ncbi:hypothetical protein ACHHYP_08910 [Achlya hypogyna]|uniref:Uncharacterized protein n=1 Tax=Achlya hypogyna TaxID=1202772 RepID=A0A1V9YNT5_ACHHY|nr:hypothetical protein ACHHYP_08910 [Achlya hypogyna]